MNHTKRINTRDRFGNQKGSSAYTVLGFLIIVCVVVAALFFFPWSDLLEKEETDYTGQAAAALKAGDTGEAVKLYTKALEKSPKNEPALVGRSRAYLKQSKLDQALVDANKAIEADDKYAIAYGQRGIILKLKGDYDGALADFSKATELFPNYVWAYSQMADIQARRNELEKALENINAALAAKGEFVAGLRLRARILTSLGKCKDAYEDFLKVEELRPEDAWSLQDHAWFLLTCPDAGIQNTAKAMELAQKAYALSEGKDPMVLETLAEAYFRQGDPHKAVEHQKEAVALQKEKCPDGSCLGDMKTRLEKYEMAARKETRGNYELLPTDSTFKP